MENELNQLVETVPSQALDTDKSLIKRHLGLYNRIIKRGLDLIFSVIFILILLPLFFIIALSIICDSGCPVFYRAIRGGYKGRKFQIIKFRTMVKNAESLGGGTTALHDSRITCIGALLRKTKLDEIPNLFNILKGDMSFVGPRPELIKYTDKYIGTEKLILKVRPGITDYSSIEFINLDEIVGETDADAAYEQKVLPKKNKLRIKYVAEISFITDCRIFLKTLKLVLIKIYRYVIKKEHR